MKTFKLVSLLIFVLGGAAIAIGALQKKNRGVTLNATEMPTPFEIEAFQLNNVDGKPFQRESFLGKYTVLYFGFTRCPDACPTTLSQWKGEIPKLSPEAKDKVQFILVSVDPENDKPDLLSRYAKGFHPDIQSATGDINELQKLAKAMKTTFHKEEESEGEPDLYMMAHSPRYFLVNPDAQLQAVYNPPLENGVLAADLNRLVDAKFGSSFLF